MVDAFETPSGRYRVLERLRAGTNGATYVVERESDGTALILKALSLSVLEEWKSYELFERQMTALRAIDHPRVPRFIDSHRDAETGNLILVQERVEGRTLRDIMDAAEPVSPEWLEANLRRLLETLQYLHASSPPIIHRDVTPSNILVDGDELYLVDFGAVKVGQSASTTMTTVGTFGYMAPEQILGRTTVQSDLFGAGMTFIALIGGANPAELPHDPHTGQVNKQAVLRNIPRRLKRTLIALTEPGSAARPASAADAVRLLDYAPAPQSIAKLPNTTKFSLSPYRRPDILSAQEAEALKQHRLRYFSPGAAVFLHYLTFGLFSIVHFGLQHDRLPVATEDDPTAGKAIGFSFIPYFNVYWWVFNPVRLADRINLQSKLRDGEELVSRNLILVAAVLSIIPTFSIVMGFILWGFAVHDLQTAINTLVEEDAADVHLEDGDNIYELPAETFEM